MRITGFREAGAEPIRALRATADDDSLGLSTPQDIAATPTGFAIVDHGNDRLVFLAATLQPSHAVARSGSGPGEFQLPLFAEQVGPGLAVGDLINRRITFLDSAGRLLRTQRVPIAIRHFATGPAGDVWMVARARDHYLARIHPSGDATPFGARALQLYPFKDRMSRELPFGAGGDLVARTPDGGLHVFDNRIGALLRLDSAGSPSMLRMLPRAIASDLRAHRDRRVAALRKANHNVVSAPLAKDLAVTSDGQLLLLFSGTDAFGLVIEPDSYDVTLLRLPRGTGAKALWGATAGVLAGDELTVISRADVLTYRLSTPAVAAR